MADGDDEEGDEEDGAEDLPGALRVSVVVVVIVAVIVRGGGSGAGFLWLVGFEFGAVGGVFVAVGGVEGGFEGEGAAAGEREGVGALSDDLVGREEAAENFDGAIVGLADDDRGFDESVRELEVFDVDETSGGIALEGGAGNTRYLGARGDDDGELGAHAGAQGEAGIGDVKSGFDRAGLGVGQSAEMLKVGDVGFAGGGDGDAGLLAGAEAAGEMLGHAGEGIDLGEVDNLGEDFVGADGLAGDDVGGADETGDRGVETNGGRRFVELAALDEDGEVTLFDEVVVFNVHLERAAGNAAADHGAATGVNLDATEGENGFFEITGFHDGGLDAEIGDAGGIKDDGLRFGRTRSSGRGGLGGGKDGDGEKRDEQTEGRRDAGRVGR